MPPELLTTNQAATYLGIHPKSLARHQRAGRIAPAVRGSKGRNFPHRYRLADVDALKEPVRAPQPVSPLEPEGPLDVPPPPEQDAWRADQAEQWLAAAARIAPARAKASRRKSPSEREVDHDVIAYREFQAGLEAEGFIPSKLTDEERQELADLRKARRDRKEWEQEQGGYPTT